MRVEVRDYEEPPRGLWAMARKAMPTFTAPLAAMSRLISRPIQGKEPLLGRFKRSHTGRPFVGAFGGLGGRGLFDPFGFGSFLGELGKFNPIWVLPHLQYLMRRSAMPRLALIILASALSERQYIVEGGTPEDERFHQEWIDRLMPRILRRASNAVWFGWQPFILDWGSNQHGGIVPIKAHDVDPITTQALEDERTRGFAGLLADGQEFGLDRAFKLTWQGDLGNPYGEGQHLTCYPYWWSHSVLLVWMMRYYERSVDPVRIALARNISVPTGRTVGGKPEKVDLTRMVAEALDAAGNGDSIAIPMGKDPITGEEKLVDIKELVYPDRSDTWLKALSYLEQKQFIATLSLPGIGVSSTFGKADFASSRIAEKTQLRILEYVSDMPVEALNDDLLPIVHRLNGRRGPIPFVRGKAFKREVEESLRELMKAALALPVPQVGPDGRPTGESYRAVDLLRFDKIGKQLDLPMYEIAEVVRKANEIQGAPGAGGRPTEPFGERAEDRRGGLDGSDGERSR